MGLTPGSFANALRTEIGARNRTWAKGCAHVESYGNPPVIVYAPEELPGVQSHSGRHGNFFHPAYAAILASPEWLRRFDKVHAQSRTLPKSDSGRRWRELDSCMSSDALLMNIFCTPGVADSPSLRGALAIDASPGPQFGWKARVPLASGRFDRTEVDMRWGSLLVEAKLTESDFQTRAASVVESYLDFDAVFDRDLLPRVELRATRPRAAVEFAEEFTQEWEPPAPGEEIARQFQQGIVTRARAAEPAELAYAGYQLIRNVLAAHATDCSFCVLHDERRPDLRESWFQVIAAVRSSEMRTRCKVLTWQELAEHLPPALQRFLDIKYGIVAPGTSPSPPDETAFA